MSPDASPEEALVEKTETNQPKTRANAVLVRHISKRVQSRSGRRVARGGGRRQGVVLDNGLRIRKKGRLRLNVVHLSEFARSSDRLMAAMDLSIIEVLDPNTMKVLSKEELFGRLNIAVKESVNPRPADATREDIDVSAVTAAVDQANAKRDGEANPPPSERDTGLLDDEGEEMSEEGDELSMDDLEKMSRKDLDKLAVDYGVEDPKKLANKGEVIDAIVAAAEGKE